MFKHLRPTRISQVFSTTILPTDEIPSMDMFDVKFSNLTKLTTGTTDKFSLTGFTVRMKRSSTPFLSNVFLPTGLLVLTSYIGFFIPVDSEEGRRITLLVTVFLMLVNISSTERNRGPEVIFYSNLFLSDPISSSVNIATNPLH